MSTWRWLKEIYSVRRPRGRDYSQETYTSTHLWVNVLEGRKVRSAEVGSRGGRNTQIRERSEEKREVVRSCTPPQITSSLEGVGTGNKEGLFLN
jgi:hypothetical protein